MIASVDAGVHSDPALFQKAIYRSSLHYEQPRELDDSEDYSKLSRCFMDCDEFCLEGPTGEELDNAGMLIGKLRRGGSWRSLGGCLDVRDSLDWLVEVLWDKSCRVIRQE